MIKRITTLFGSLILVVGCSNDGNLFDDGAVVTGPFGSGGQETQTSDPDSVPVVIAEPDGDAEPPVIVIPEETAPEETAPEETAPEETAPEETAPEETAPEETAQLSDAEIDATSRPFLLPGDCIATTGSDGRGYCYSAAAGQSLYATTANGRLVWTASFADRNGFEVREVIADENVHLLMRATDGSGLWLLVRFGLNGETLYTTEVLAGVLEVSETLVMDNSLYLIASRGESGQQLVRINTLDGTEQADLRFPEQFIQGMSLETLDDGSTRLVLDVDGRNRYYDPQTLERLISIGILDPSNYQALLPVLMDTLRGRYADEYRLRVHQVQAAIDSGEIASSDGTGSLDCPGGGTLQLLPENSMLDDMIFNRAFSFSDCVIGNDTLDGQAVHSVLGVTTSTGNNGTEVMKFTGMRISDNSQADGSDNVRTLDATISNVWTEQTNNQSGDQSSSDWSMEVQGYENSLTGLVVSEASYARKRIPGWVTEAGDATLSGEFSAQRSMTLSIEPDLGYNPAVNVPGTGTLTATADDGSSLVVDASNGSEGSIVYRVVTEEGEAIFDDAWLANPIDSSLRL